MQRLIGAVLLLLMLAACTQTPAATTQLATITSPTAATKPTVTTPPTATTQPATAPITAEPPASPTPTGACPVETAELKLFTNTTEGFCFLYPAADTPLAPNRVVINPNGVSGGDFLPGDALVLIQVEAASGRTAAQVADEKIAEAGEGFDITRRDIVIGGKQASVVDGLPAQDPWREVFIVGNDRLYHLFFQPWTPDAGWFAELEALYSAVSDSFHVFPPES